MNTPDPPPPPPPPGPPPPPPVFEILDDGYDDYGAPPPGGSGSRVVMWVLIGVALLCLVLGVGAWLLVSGVRSLVPKVQDLGAQAQMAVLAQTIEEYKRAEGRFPPSLDALVRTGRDGGTPYLAAVPRDPWGRRFQYRTIHGGKIFQLRSLGPDGAPDTDDDIRFEER